MKYVYEFLGAFFLVLTVGMTVYGANNPGDLAPLAIGSVLAVMVYAGGHISGGHYNPAISLAVYLRGKLSAQDLGLYWIAQLLGGVVAAFAAIYLQGGRSDSALEMDHARAFIAEFIFTFALCYVVLNVATANATKGNSYFGLAIGFTVLAGAFAVGSISGGAFNPAVGLGQSIMNISAWADLWVYVIAALLGGAVSAWVFKEAHPGE